MSKTPSPDHEQNGITVQNHGWQHGNSIHWKLRRSKYKILLLCFQGLL